MRGAESERSPTEKRRRKSIWRLSKGATTSGVKEDDHGFIFLEEDEPQGLWGGRLLQGMVKSLQNPSLLVIFLVILIKALKILRGLRGHLITLALNHICILVLRTFVSMVMAGSD